MQSFFAYHFLLSLSFALLNSLWQMAFLWIVYNIIVTLFTIKPSTNFKLLIATQTSGFLWFVYTLFVSLNSNNASYYENISSIYSPFIQEKLLPLAAVIYLFFAFVFIAKFCIQFYSLKDIRKNELLPISDKWKQFIDDTKGKLEIARTIQIKISKTITTPLTIGFIKPIILIPVAAINNLTTQELEAILLHELAHIKRNDYVVNLLVLFVNAIMFFNPFSKYIACLIDKQRELSCDDEVLDNNYSNSLYAEALLNVAKFQLQNHTLFGTMTAVNTNQQELKHRIKRILNIETESKNWSLFSKQIGFSLFFGLLLFALIGFININVKKVIADGVPIASNTSFVSKPIITNLQAKKIDNSIEIKVQHKHKTSKNFEQKQDLVKNNDELQSNRKTIEQGFKMLSKLATENDIVENVNASSLSEEDIVINDENNLTITPTVESHPTTTVQKYFVPATSKSSASIIIVTTTEKENGKKVVKIEIEKGEGKVE
jgi:beta-lactamase regulating signal transducer with metallopeptidase domain